MEVIGHDATSNNENNFLHFGMNHALLMKSTPVDVWGIELT